MIIHDHYQGKGIGYKLIDVLIGIAQEKGLEEFYGIVLADNQKNAPDLPKIRIYGQAIRRRPLQGDAGPQVI